MIYILRGTLQLQNSMKKIGTKLTIHPSRKHLSLKTEKVMRGIRTIDFKKHYGFGTNQEYLRDVFKSNVDMHFSFVNLEELIHQPFFGSPGGKAQNIVWNPGIYFRFGSNIIYETQKH